MKKITTLLVCLLALSGCASREPRYEDSQNSIFIKTNYDAVDKLFATATVPIDRNTPMLVSTLVSIDDLNRSSRFGRLISEQISSRITQLGFNVTELKLRNSVAIKEDAGELLLSRDVRELSKSHNAQAVLVGNYAVSANQIYMTLKIVTVADNRAVAAFNYMLPMTDNNALMLKQQ